MASKTEFNILALFKNQEINSNRGENPELKVRSECICVRYSGQNVKHKQKKNRISVCNVLKNKTFIRNLGIH